MKFLVPIFLFAAVAFADDSIKVVSHNGDTFAVRLSHVSSVSEVIDGNYYFSKYQGKVIYLNPTLTETIAAGLKNGNLRRMKQTRIVMISPDKSTYEIVVDLPVSVVIDQLGLER